MPGAGARTRITSTAACPLKQSAQQERRDNSMRYIVLFQHSCHACSQVARMVRDLSVTGLEARPLEDPEVTGLLSHAGLETPDRPSLLVADSKGIEVLSGWAMRRRLAGVIGWRRSGAITGLLAAEWRARLARSADSHAPSRRGVIGGALAGAAGWALMSGTAFASARPVESKPELTVADPAEVRAALATVPGQRALSTWGAVEQQAFKVRGGGRVTLMLTHPRARILTFISMSPGALRGGNPAAVSLGEALASDHAIRYYSVGGTPLADLMASSGRVQASPVPRDAVVPGRTAEVEPELTPKQIACFIACIGRKAGAGCIQNCITCVAGIVYKNPPPIPCAECAACAGPYGTDCVGECGL